MRDYFNADSFHSYEEGKMTIGKKDKLNRPRNIWKECRFQPPSIDIDGSEEKRASYGHDQLKITAISRIGFEPIKLLAL